MTKSRFFKRALIVITVLALIICFAQTAVFADNTVEVKDGSYNGTEITVTGSISTSGAEMTMLAVRTTEENVELSSYATPDDLAAAVQYIDQVTATSDSFEKAWTFALRDGGDDLGDYVVVFVSGTDANVEKLAIPLEVKTGENGTVSFGDDSDFVGSVPAFKLEGGDDNWAGQLVGTITDAEGAVVEGADVAFGNGIITVTMDAPFEKTTYTITVTNSSDDYPDFSAAKTFTLISEDGAAAAAAIEELNALPGTLGVEVDKTSDENKYSFVIPDGTDNVEYAVTVDGASETNKTFDVEKSEASRTVVVTATAKGTDVTRTYTVTVPAIGAAEPTVSAENVVVIKADAYGAQGKTLIAVTVGTDVVDPAAASMTVGGEKLFYSPQKEKFYGVVDSTLAPDSATAASNIVIAEAASENMYFGVVLSSGPSMTGRDFGFAGRTTLNNESPTFKQYIAMDVNNVEPDGSFNGRDFGALGRHSLGADLPVLPTAN